MISSEEPSETLVKDVQMIRRRFLDIVLNTGKVEDGNKIAQKNKGS